MNNTALNINSSSSSSDQMSNTGSNEPPDEMFRRKTLEKLSSILSSLSAQKSSPVVLEQKLYDKVMREQGTKAYYEFVFNQMMKKLEEQTLKQQLQSQHQTHQQSQNQQKQNQSHQQHFPPSQPQQPGAPLQPQQFYQQQNYPQQPPQPVSNQQQQQQQQQHILNYSNQQNIYHHPEGTIASGQNTTVPMSTQQQSIPQQGMNQQPPPQQQYMVQVNQPPNQPQMMMNQGMNGGNMPIGAGTNQDPMSALKTMSTTSNGSMGPQLNMGMISRHPMPPQQPGMSPMSMGPQPSRGRMQYSGTPQQANFMGNSPAMLGPHVPPQQQMMGQTWMPAGPPGTPGMQSAPSPRPGGMVPSPGNPQFYHNTSINTPMMPTMMAGASPQAAIASPQSDELRLRIQKLQQLSKFIAPLRAFIDRFQQKQMEEQASGTASADREKEVIKIKKLYDIISNPTSAERVDLKTLIKCEEVLEKMKFENSAFGQAGVQIVGGPPMIPVHMHQSQQQPISNAMPMIPTTSNTTTMSSISSANLCQPLLDAIQANIKKPHFTATLARTFSPACAALGFIPTYSTNPASLKKSESDSNENGASGGSPHKKLKLDFDALYDDESSTETLSSKEILEGEIARLDPKFKVEEDPLSHPGSKSTQIIVYLDNPDLPFVPPVSIRIPETYPNNPPVFLTESCSIFNQLSSSSSQGTAGAAGDDGDGDSDDFFTRIRTFFTRNCKNLPPTHSLTQLLDTWELSIRQACHPARSA